jgi:putative transposase
MGRMPRELSRTGMYHVIARGINHEHIFEAPEDYNYFKDVIKKLKDEFCFSIYAYCLMSNHIHILIKEKNEYDLSTIMQRIFIRYARYFNQKYSRSGSLIGNRFKSKAVEVDSYFFPLIVYIHRNPVEAGMEIIPEHYPYSSCRDYFEGNRSGLTDIDFTLNMIDIENLKKLHNNKCNVDFMLEILESKKEQNDFEKEISIKEILGELSAFEINGLEKNVRDHYICELRNIGLKLNEIERLTGVSRGVIIRSLKQNC